MAENTMKGLSLVAIVIAGLAMIVLAGYALVQQYEYTLRDVTNTSVNGITVATNGSATAFGDAYDWVTSVTGCVNASDATDVLSADNYTVNSGGKSSTGGGFVLKDAGAAFVGETVNCSSVTYRAANTQSDKADQFLTGLVVFGTFLAVIVLAVFGKTIWRVFSTQK